MQKKLNKSIRNYYYKKNYRDFILNKNPLVLFKNLKKLLFPGFSKLEDLKDKPKAIKKALTFEKRTYLKFAVIIAILVFTFSNSFSWLYEYYLSHGSLITTGEISHEIIEYDDTGAALLEDSITHTLIYETNMSNVTKSTKFLEVRNTGTLDMEYSVSFSLEGTIEVSGIMFYRIYDITSEVNNETISATYPTRLQAYAANNPIDPALETDTTKPVSNMSLLNNLIVTGTVEVNNDPTLNSKYYRIDYGMYTGVTTTAYQDDSFSVHLNVYSSQVGTISNSANSHIWEVSTETQLREVLLSSNSGDTIRLIDDISIAGNLAISKRINLDTNDYILNIAGDLIYDFVNLGNLTIDVSGEGRIRVGNNFNMTVPKASVHIIGNDKNYDFFVGGTVTWNAIQDGENDGILLENVNFVSSTQTLMPINVNLLSNTRLTLAPGVRLGFVYANQGSTNIEVINNGIITQLQFQDMNLLATFTKAQIYVYNLGTILGVEGSTGILLPTTSTPYLGPNNGNTLIVRGITSSDITVSGSQNYTLIDIQNNYTNSSVIPYNVVPNVEPDSYMVYIRENNVSVESLLTEYFEQRNVVSASASITGIKNLMIYTLNAQYVENEDFAFFKSTRIPNLEYLNLENSRIKDDSNGTTVYNKIVDGAMEGKTSLKTLLLPNTLIEIGDYAFNGIVLGHLSNLSSESFSFITIPETVEEIGDYAFYNAEYVKMRSANVPTLYAHSFNTSNSGAKYFVPHGSISTYQENQYINEINVHETADLSDNRRYFLYDSINGGYGISYNVNNLNTSTTLGIPGTEIYNGTEKNITAIGTSAYRDLSITNAEGVALILESTVAKIDAYAFYDLNIKSASFSSITEVGDYAFYSVPLARVFGNNITKIGNYAFYESGITNLSLGNISSIGNYAFTNNLSLTEIDLGNIRTIGNYAFSNCQSITKATFDTIETEIVNNAEEMNIQLGTNALVGNWGSYTDGRLRIYVPNGLSSNNVSYLSLYKKLLPNVAQYVYQQGLNSTIAQYGYPLGTDSDTTYTHLMVPFVFNDYTVKEVSLTNKNGNSVTGWEIISYQGADLNNSYDIPNSITAGPNNITYPVISIGEGAYRNVNIETDHIIEIDNSNLLKIGSYAFYNLELKTIHTPEVLQIGSYAFSGTSLEVARFENLQVLGDYALTSITNLYSLNIGKVALMGYNCISDNANLEQLFINNTDLNIVLNGSPFANIGTNSNERLRIYVPDSTTSLTYYKNLISEYADYIYPTGTIIGSFVNGSLYYDIGEYTVKEVTLNNYANESVTGWEIIEYHGANLSSSFDIATNLTAITSNLTASVVKVGNNGNVYQYAVTITNNGNTGVSSWKMNMTLPSSVTYNSVSNALVTNNTTSLYIRNTPSNAVIAAGGTATFTIYLETLITSYMPYFSDVNVTNPTGTTLPVISVGNYAFIHTISEQDASINITNDNLLSIGIDAFRNITNIKSLILNEVLTVGSGAFYNNATIETVTFNHLNEIRANAFGNSSRLFNINFGKVTIMDANVLTNAPYLEQVFFDVRHVNLAIDYQSINNVGSQANNRLRFYVTDGTDTNNIPYVNTYRDLFLNEYKDYFYPKGYIIGNYSQPNSPFVIGDYSVREVTVKDKDNNDVTGWEFIEYHGADLSGAYNFPDEATYISSTISGVLRYNRSWNNNVTYNDEYYVDIYNNGTLPTTSWQFDLDYSSGATVTTYSCNKVNGANGLTITNASWNKTIAVGEFESCQVIISYSSPDIYASISNVRQASDAQITNPIVVIGDYAFSHALSNSNTSFDIINNDLIYIGDSAFDNFTGAVNLSSTGVIEVGEYAFRGNHLQTINLPNLVTLGQYAFANNPNLYYANLGKTTSLPSSVLAGAVNLTQLFLNNTTIPNGSTSMNLAIGENALLNVGQNMDQRFRIYVPAGSIPGAQNNLTYVTAYKNTLPSSFSLYIYETGTLIGDNYNHGSIPYVIKEYMVKMTTIDGVNGLQIIDYHGPDISTNYAYPDTLYYNNANTNVIAIGDGAFRLTDVTNSWTFDIETSNLQSIGDYAFYNFSAIDVINTPNLKTVGSYAFRYNNISYFSAPQLTSIGNYALADNTLLYYVDAGLIEVISYGLFYNDAAMLQMFFRSTHDDSTSSRMSLDIQGEAFTNMGNISSKRFRIYVPDGIVPNTGDTLTYLQAYKNTFPTSLAPYIFETGFLVGAYVYSNTYSIFNYMIKEVTIDGTTGWQIVDYHGPDAGASFVMDSPMTNALGEELPVISIGDNSFRYTIATTGSNWSLTLPSSVIYIGDYAFYQRDVYELTASDLIYIGERAFYQCRKLTTVAIGDAEVISDYAFYNTTVSTVTLGDDVSSIGNYAFYNTYDNNALSNFYIMSTTPPTIYSTTFPPRRESSSFFGTTYSFNITFHVPYAYQEDYETAPNWSYYKGTVPGLFGSTSYDRIVGIGSISNNYFVFNIINTNEAEIVGYTRTSVSNNNLTVPTSLRTSSSNTYYTVTSIAGNAFDNLTSLTKITLPSSLKAIGDNFLAGNRSLQSINVSGGTYFTSIDSVLFSYDRTALIKFPSAKTTTNNSYAIPSTTRVIVAGAFSGNRYTTQVTLNTDLVAIGNGAFDNTTRLNNYYFEGSVPPYLLGFDVFPVSSSLRMYYRTAYFDTYNTNIFYSKYSAYAYTY